MRPFYDSGNIVLLRKINKNYKISDVVACEHFFSDTTISAVSLGRLMALPGDIFEIKNKKIFINSKLINDSELVLYNYLITTQQTIIDSTFLKENNIPSKFVTISNNFEYGLTLGAQEFFNLKQNKLIKNIEVKNEKEAIWDENIYPNNANYSWNLDNYGPLKIPKKGDSLRIDSTSYYLYKFIFDKYEATNLILDSIKQKPKTVVIQNNYYIILSDNRDNGCDSRNFGPIPQNAIKGIAIWKLKTK